MLGNVVLVKNEAKYGKPSYRLAKMLATKEEVSVLDILDGVNTEAAPTRPKMPIVTAEDDADSIEDLERVDAVAHTPHHT